MDRVSGRRSPFGTRATAGSLRRSVDTTLTHGFAASAQMLVHDGRMFEDGARPLAAPRVDEVRHGCCDLSGPDASGQTVFGCRITSAGTGRRVTSMAAPSEFTRTGPRLRGAGRCRGEEVVEEALSMIPGCALSPDGYHLDEAPG